MECENMNQKELLQRVMEYKFAITDMALFLDTNPCNQNALNKHNEYVQKYKEAKKQYESEYGPLNIDTEVNSWEKWVYESWPWERREF